MTVVAREVAYNGALQKIAPPPQSRATFLLAVCTFCIPACDRALGLNELTFERDGGAEAPPSAGGVNGGPISPECSRHAECVEANLGEPSLCRDSRCIALKNTDPRDGAAPGECRVVVGAQSLDSGIEPFLIGALTPIDIISPESSAPMLNYRLAFEEMSVRGSYRIAGESRTPVLVACNSETTAPSLDRSFDHLVDTLGVTAIISAISDAEQLQRSFERIVAEKRKSVFFLSARSAPPVGPIDSAGLLWHLLPSVSDLAPVYVALVQRVEEYVNPSPSSGPRPAIRLALVVATDYLQLAHLGEILNRELIFNGKTAEENGPEHFRLLGVSSAYTSAEVDVSAPLAELREFKPHVIVSAAGPELLTILRILEEDRLGAEQQRPFYVLSPDQLGQRSEISSAVLQGHIRERNLQQRIVGVHHAGALDTVSYDRYLARLQGKFPSAGYLERTEQFYDAAYFVAYAAAAGARTPLLTGRDLVSGIHRLLAGMRVDVGPDHFAGALEYLRGDPNRTVLLHGTLGPPDFSSEGTRQGTGSAWCVEHVGSYDFRIAFDVLRYNPADGALATGGIECIDGF